MRAADTPHGAVMSRPASHIALCAAAAPSGDVALCAAMPLPAGQGDAPPDWIHLLPAGEITTRDGRGPYRVRDAGALIAESLAPGDRLPLDENHSIDVAAPLGQPSPALGWIIDLQSRADGIWGQVEWTGPGRQTHADKAYRWISPVIAHRADKTVTGLLRASLTNTPNLRGLTALHSQDPAMDFMTSLRKALGLPADATEACVLAKVAEHGASLNAVARAAGLAEGALDGAAVLQAVSTHAAQLRPIARVLGLNEAADAATVLQAVTTLADPARTVPATAVVALQAEITALKTGVARDKAEGVVDAAIKAGKIAQPQVMRDHYIARHMADPAAVERELGAMVPLGGRGSATGNAPTLGRDGKPQLDASEAKIVQLMGIDPAAYRKTQEAMSSHEEAL